MKSIELELRRDRSVRIRGTGLYLERARTATGLYLFTLSCEGEPARMRMDS
jgi:hypothetical protein